MNELRFVLFEPLSVCVCVLHLRFTNQTFKPSDLVSKLQSSSVTCLSEVRKSLVGCRIQCAINSTRRPRFLSGF